MNYLRISVALGYINEYTIRIFETLGFLFAQLSSSLLYIKDLIVDLIEYLDFKGFLQSFCDIYKQAISIIGSPLYFFKGYLDFLVSLPFHQRLSLWEV